MESLLTKQNLTEWEEVDEEKQLLMKMETLTEWEGMEDDLFVMKISKIAGAAAAQTKFSYDSGFKREMRRRLKHEEEERAAKQREAHEKEERIYQELVAEQELEGIGEYSMARFSQPAFMSYLHIRRMEMMTIDLLERMDGTPIDERISIGGVSTDQLLVGVTVTRMRTYKLELPLGRFTRLSNAQAVITIQAWWRGILARRRHRVQIEVIAVRMKEFNQQADKIMKGDNEGGSMEKSISVSKRLEKDACYTTSKLRERSVSGETSIIVSIVQAAIRIQAWWRGILARRRHRVKIELIAVRMKEFNQQADKAMEGDVERERAISVSERLGMAKNRLQNPIRLYDIKVACYTTMSLCRLSSHCCELAISFNLPKYIIAMFTVQADRSPAFEEIIEFGVQALEEMVKCPTVRVRESMVAQGTDVVRIAAHQMLAFHLNKTIASTAIKILRQCKEILPVETHDNTFSKMHSYYFKKGEEKFGKLPSNDVRRKEFVELKKAFSK